MSPPADPLRRIARALGDLRERVVFIGGSIAPILQSIPPMPRARATDDVDALLVSATYSESAELEEAVAGRGFRRDVVASRPGIAEEMNSAPLEVRTFAAAELRKLLAHPDAEEVVAAHLNDARPLAPVVQWTLERVREMAGS